MRESSSAVASEPLPGSACAVCHGKGLLIALEAVPPYDSLMVRAPLLIALVALAACAKAGGGDTDATASDTSRPIDALADGNGCTAQPCTILPQCGCGGATACDVDTSDNNGAACRSITAPGKETATCTGLDGCDRGYVCLGGAAYASCKKYCTGDADCGSPRGKCAITISSGGQPIPGIPTVCSSNCDPLNATQAECPTTYKCGLFRTTFMGASTDLTDCSPAGAGQQGADCKSGTLGNDALCAKTFSCTTTDAGATYRCRKFCTNPGVAASAQCANQACIAFTNPYTIAGVTYGVCAP